MKLFCRQDHTPPVEEPRDLKQELLEARANLVRLKKLPISSFRPRIQGVPFGEYSVDLKNDAIARAEADIAELEVLYGE